MAITTLGELQTTIGSWLNRGDMTARALEFLELGDARIRREQNWDYRVYTLESGGMALNITSQGQTMPAGVRTVKDLWPTTGSRLLPLEQTTFAELRKRANSNLDATGTPIMYALVPARNPFAAGPKLFLWPRPSGAFSVDFLYINDVGKVSPSGTELFTYAPDLYLYAALSTSAPFLKNDERVVVWESLYMNALNGLNKQQEDAMFGSSVKRTRLRQSF